MAKVYTSFPIIGTMYGMTFYMSEGKNLVRKKSSLTGKRVKRSPEFARTRFYAGQLAQASKIASVIYQALPAGWRQYWMFREFTGEATRLLKAGKTREEAITGLKKVYVEEIRKAEDSRYKVQGTGSREQGTRDKAQETGYRTQDTNTRRKYIKKDAEYWKNKTEKAIIKSQKRKAQQEKLQYYAGLMAKASKIGSAVYQSIPKDKRQYWQYRGFTGLAMGLLKKELEEEMVLAFLKSEAGGQMSEGRSLMPDAGGLKPEVSCKKFVRKDSFEDVGNRRRKAICKKVRSAGTERKHSLFFIPQIPARRKEKHIRGQEPVFSLSP